MKEYVKISVGEYQRLYDCEKELAVIKSEKSEFIQEKLKPIINKIFDFLNSNGVDIKIYGDINNIKSLDQVVCQKLPEDPKKMFVKIVKALT